MKKAFAVLFSLMVMSALFSQVRMTVVDLSNNNITFKNMGNTTEDISAHRLCSLLDYSGLSDPDVALVDGTLNLMPGESVTVAWNTAGAGMNPAGADLCLYLPTGSFGDSNSILDFTQWGSGGNGRENVAAAAGIWLAGEFIATASPFYFSGGANDHGLLFWSSDPPPTTCSDLFFSEYLEGSSNNKALEIYNPTTNAIDLGGYEVHRFNNGGTTGAVSGFDAGTMLDPGAVYVFGNPSADVEITGIADSLSSATFFNGDDALLLINVAAGDTLDAIGVVGMDPGSFWPVGSGFTAEYTLVRMNTIQEGTTDWNVGSTQWDVQPQNTFSFLGSHAMIPCGSTTPVVGFTSSTITVAEDAGNVDIMVSLANNNTVPSNVTVNYTGGSASDAIDFVQTLPTPLMFPGTADESLSISLDIIDDIIEEDDETIELVLTMPENAEIEIDTLVITIMDNDAIIPLYDIGEINTVDADGVSDSLGVNCKVEATVYGVNLRPQGLQFTLHDGTGGIGVFFNTGDLGYTVNEGDNIRLIGTVSQFSGLTQMNPDSIVFLSAGNPLNAAFEVTELNEDTESELIKIECVSIVDPNDWSPGGSGFNVDLTDGVNTYDMRIDADVDLFNEPAPTGTFSVIGIGGQFDTSIPHDEGYHILPRYSADILADDPNCNVPANNDCTGAIDISDLFVIGSTETSGIFSNEGASVAGSDPADGWECFGEPDGSGTGPSLENTVWFQFEVPACQIVGEPLISISTNDCDGAVTDYIDDGDTQMALYSGTCENLVPVACNEDSPDATAGNFFAELQDIVLSPGSYSLLIDGFNFNGSISEGEFCISVTMDCPFSVSELEQININLFPNPGNGQITLETEERITQIQVFDTHGRSVQFEQETDLLKSNLDLSGNANGLYQIVVSTEKGQGSVSYILRD